LNQEEQNKEGWIREIIDLEWDMFQNTNNIGGRAACQEDEDTFRIMRDAQFKTWGLRCLQSYLADLQKAQKTGLNLVELKYAYMMEHTHPELYAVFSGQLPGVTDRKAGLARMIGKIHLRWSEECAGKYPVLAATGRPMYSREDTPWQTSSETYLRGELYSYSERTLELYLEQVSDAEKCGNNLCEAILNHTVRAYGYESAKAYEVLAERNRMSADTMTDSEG